MAMVEMVFVAPILILLVFAIAQFGLMFQKWLTLSNAVREGARVGVVYRSPCNSGDVVNEARAAVLNYADNAGHLNPVDVSVNVNGACASGSDLTVDASYPFDLSIPFASSLGPINLTYSSTMRNE